MYKNDCPSADILPFQILKEQNGYIRTRSTIF